MKSTTLPILTASAALLAQQAHALLELPKFNLLRNNEKVSALETIAYVNTYDEVPIFGGEEYREKVLSKGSKAKKASKFDAMDSFRALQSGAQELGAQAHQVASNIFKPKYASNTSEQIQATEATSGQHDSSDAAWLTGGSALIAAVLILQ